MLTSGMRLFAMISLALFVAFLISPVSAAVIAWGGTRMSLDYTTDGDGVTTGLTVYSITAGKVVGNVKIAATITPPVVNAHNHAAVWTYGPGGTGSTTWQNLNDPAVTEKSSAFGVDGDHAFGDSNVLTGSVYHATLYNISTDTEVDLGLVPGDPLYTETKGQGIVGNQAVGRVTYSGKGHAALWTMAGDFLSATFTDLNPTYNGTAADSSYANDIRGTYQLGYFVPGVSIPAHPRAGQRVPCYWDDTAASVVELASPDARAGIAASGSEVWAADGTAMAGYTSYGTSTKYATYWADATGSPTTPGIDMTPSAATAAYIWSMDGGYEAGSASIGTQTHAYLWKGGDPEGMSLASLFTDFTGTVVRGMYVEGSDIWLAVQATGGTPSPSAFVVHLTVPLGDANLDGVVNDTDASILGSHWQLQSGASWAMGDFNNDGKVNDADAAILAAHWSSGGEEGSVPEPSTLAMLLGAAVMAWLGRRQSR